MTRFRTLLLAAALAATSAGAVVSSARPVDAQKASPDVAGTWATTWGAQRATLVLTQQGLAVTGHYTTTGAPPGTVSGTMDGTVLTGRWSDRGGADGGFRLVFDPAGRSFRGTWGSGASDVDGGSWDGSR